MTEVDDRLVPQDGLSDWGVGCWRMTTLRGRAAIEFQFEISALNQSIYVPVIVPVQKDQGLDHMMVQAHDEMIDILVSFYIALINSGLITKTDWLSCANRPVVVNS